MNVQNIEVRIQDVDALNAKIFENGWMYVSDSHGNKECQYFAPYFTEGCAIPGISMISHVVHVVRYKVADLLAKQIAQPDALSEQHLRNWRIGVSAIRARAKAEGWDPAGMGKLFYLNRPETFRTPALTKTSYNDTNPPKNLGPSRIPRGFTLKYDELLTKSSWSLENPPG
ncbi:MAG: hypothetical protein OXL37_15580 [Chloroflexota bacterium]|nr:hypothetical protein [Chloroflexota bacterium]MDE2961864.1 hypothetical protein [Chloroflexota bacterium]